MELSEGYIAKSVRWREGLWARMKEVARNQEFKSENELFNYIMEVGLDNLNGQGHSDDDDASPSPSSSPLENNNSDDDDASPSPSSLKDNTRKHNSDDDDASPSPSSSPDSNWDLMEV